MSVAEQLIPRATLEATMNVYEELAVLEEGDDGAIVAIRGQGGPSVLLGPAYLGHLAALLGQVNGDERLLQYPDYTHLLSFP
jgi:hypothetical protein